MKILICWTHVSGYMAACWRALAEKPGMDLSIVAFSTQETARSGVVGYTDDIVRGLDARLLAPGEQNDAGVIAAHAASLQPDVVVFPGWAYPGYSSLTNHPALK